jgi:hypothetical protein
MTRYTYETDIDLSDDGDRETEVKVSFTVAWGSPESGRFGPPENYDPGSGSVVEDIRVEAIDGRPVNDGDAATVLEIVARLQADHTELMLDEAAEERAADRERAEEYRAEARREAW